MLGKSWRTYLERCEWHHPLAEGVTTLPVSSLWLGGWWHKVQGQMLLDQLSSLEHLKKTSFSLCFPSMGHNFYLSTHKPQKSEMHYNSMYVTVVWQMGDSPELLLGEPCAVTAGNGQSQGQCFPGEHDRILELRLFWKRKWADVPFTWLWGLPWDSFTWFVGLWYPKAHSCLWLIVITTGKKNSGWNCEVFHEGQKLKKSFKQKVKFSLAF